jgi:hypothetical protein
MIMGGLSAHEWGAMLSWRAASGRSGCNPGATAVKSMSFEVRGLPASARWHADVTVDGLCRAGAPHRVEFGPTLSCTLSTTDVKPYAELRIAANHPRHVESSQI